MMTFLSFVMHIVRLCIELLYETHHHFDQVSLHILKIDKEDELLWEIASSSSTLALFTSSPSPQNPSCFRPSLFIRHNQLWGIQHDQQVIVEWHKTKDSQSSLSQIESTSSLAPVPHWPA